MKKFYTFVVIMITISCCLPLQAQSLRGPKIEGPGPKIEGPWVWTIVSTGDKGGRNAATSGIDYLSQASEGTVTERNIATNGARAGDAIGNRVWTSGKIASTGRDNITEMLNTIGLDGNRDKHVAYGCISIYGINHDTMMHVGGDDAVKVWLNGALVHTEKANGGATDYESSFPITLKKGENILLVAVYDQVREWSGFFGFDTSTFYGLDPPDIVIPPGPKIEGPWVWTIVPTGNIGGADAAASGTDYLAEASEGTVTERNIATNGASVGEAIGNRVWTPGKIAPTGNNNITEMLTTIGLDGNRDKHVAYGCISIYTARQQDTRMHIGSDDAIKVWLNGVLVHANARNRSATDYESSFPVPLKKGKNILLVAVYDNTGAWSGFFGFRRGTSYSLTPIDTVLRISPSPVATPAVGQQLTFNLNIANGIAVAGYQVTINFDNTALRYVGSSKGNYLHSDAYFVHRIIDDSRVELISTIPTGIGNGNGTLATFTFEVLTVKPSILTLSSVLLSDKQGNSFQPILERGEITEPPTQKEDVTGDGVVNIRDLVMVSSEFGNRGKNAMDINKDGIVNISDLVLVAGAFSTGTGAPSLDSGSSELLTTADVREWISQAHQLNDLNVNSQRGILVLEQLLAALTPKETLLLPNYPNPFNPETWIPYQLAKAGDVKIVIYDAKGVMVRTLLLGHQSAGYYTSKSRAAYWDGRNALGERVASGVYFYQFETDERSSMRKMVILK